MTASNDQPSNQELLTQQRSITEQVNLRPMHALPQLVVGLDAAYDEDSSKAVGAAVVIDTASFEIVEQATATVAIPVDYRPGFLAFREAPVLLAAMAELRHEPELVVCDGHGIAHPARAGLACHVGVALGVPTIGCAKNHLRGSFADVGPERGEFQPLLAATADSQPEADSGVIGAALRTRTDTKCVFVSPGHLIDVASSVEHILALTPRFRLPETTRAADRLCRAAIADSLNPSRDDPSARACQRTGGNTARIARRNGDGESGRRSSRRAFASAKARPTSKISPSCGSGTGTAM